MSDDLPTPANQGGPAEQGGMPGLGGFDLGSMVQMAADMQSKMVEAQEELANAEVLGTAGGGLVTVTLNGHLHLRGVHIDPSAVDPDDPSMLEDLVRAAWQDAHDQVAELQAANDPLGGLGGIDAGGLGGLLGGGG
jgi:DNA-binding YbaB/EbfC family protein